MPTDVDGVFTSQEARAYWDSRHATAGSLQSGGHIRQSDAEAALLYAVRIARVADALGLTASVGYPVRLLDAGCGKGHFSRALAQFGFLVDGVDFSPSAVAYACERAGARESYAVRDLGAWAPPYLYDAVLSVDVLYHVMDDAEWERIVRNLAGLTRLGGRLLLVDHRADTDHTWSRYQRTRSVERYREVLASCGVDLRGHLPNGFPHDPSGIHCGVRVR